MFYYLNLFKQYFNASLKIYCADFQIPFKIQAMLRSVHPIIVACGTRMFLRFHSKYQQCSTLYLDFQYLGHMDHFEYCE